MCLYMRIREESDKSTALSNLLRIKITVLLVLSYVSVLKLTLIYVSKMKTLVLVCNLDYTIDSSDWPPLLSLFQVFVEMRKRFHHILLTEGKWLQRQMNCMIVLLINTNLKCIEEVTRYCVKLFRITFLKNTSGSCLQTLLIC